MSVRLRFRYPFSGYIAGPNVESLGFTTRFVHKGFSVVVNPLGGKEEEPIKADTLPEEERWFRKVSFLEFEVHVPDSENLITAFLKESGSNERKTECYLFLVEMINRVLRAYRHEGLAVEVHEARPRLDAVDSDLSWWRLEVSEDDKEWKVVISTPRALGVFGAFLLPPPDPTPVLKASTWRGIEEAIESNPDPPPEQEFVANAIEFLREGNFRMAVIESVIALEIVLTQYLNEELTRRRSIQQDDVRRFLSPNLHLADRIGVILPLLIGEEKLLQEIDIPAVRKTIGWRNKITHGTGRLPESIKEDALRDGISKTLGLVWLLAEKREQLRAEPALSQMADKLRQQFSLRTVFAGLKGRRLVWIDISAGFADSFDLKVLDGVAQEAISMLTQRDSHFSATRDLFIVVHGGMPSRAIAFWAAGKSHEAKSKPLPQETTS